MDAAGDSEKGKLVIYRLRTDRSPRSGTSARRLQNVAAQTTQCRKHGGRHNSSRGYGRRDFGNAHAWYRFGRHRRAVCEAVRRYASGGLDRRSVPVPTSPDRDVVRADAAGATCPRHDTSCATPEGIQSARCGGITKFACGVVTDMTPVEA